jgi:hypothetical protein
MKKEGSIASPLSSNSLQGWNSCDKCVKHFLLYGLGLVVGLLPAVVYVALLHLTLGPLFCTNQTLDVQFYNIGVPLGSLLTFLVILAIGIKYFKMAKALSFGIFTLLGALLVASYAFFLVWEMASLALWATPC